MNEPVHTRLLTGDGRTVRFDLGVPIRQIIAVKLGDHDRDGANVAHAVGWQHVDVYPPLAEGAVVTVWFLSDYL